MEVIVKTRCRRCRCLIDYGNTYCDRCKSATLKENKKGLKNKRVEATTKSGAWKSVRGQILLRDKSCILCRNRDNYFNIRNLQVHHIIKRVNDESLIYEPKNLVTLCRQCHDEIEELPVAKQIELLGEYKKEIDYTLL